MLKMHLLKARSLVHNLPYEKIIYLMPTAIQRHLIKPSQWFQNVAQNLKTKGLKNVFLSKYLEQNVESVTKGFLKKGCSFCL